MTPTRTMTINIVDRIEGGRGVRSTSTLLYDSQRRSGYSTGGCSKQLPCKIHRPNPSPIQPSAPAAVGQRRSETTRGSLWQFVSLHDRGRRKSSCCPKNEKIPKPARSGHLHPNTSPMTPKKAGRRNDEWRTWLSLQTTFYLHFSFLLTTED